MDSETAIQWLLLIATSGVSIHYYPRPLAKYLFCWAVFHSSEYSLTKMCQPRTLTPHSFLIYGARGSLHLLAVHLISITEHFILRSRHYDLSLSQLGMDYDLGLSQLGMVMALGGVVIRALAMYQCGESFSHYIETQRRGHNTLVTCGIYKWCRHPSYLGFLVYVIGMQLILGTVVSHTVSLIILMRFFVRRIRFEEWFLVNRLYGAEYSQYQDEVACLVPYIY